MGREHVQRPWGAIGLGGYEEGQVTGGTRVTGLCGQLYCSVSLGYLTDISDPLLPSAQKCWRSSVRTELILS